MQGSSIEHLYSKFLESGGVSIDTRTIRPGDFFFALKGPNFDANKYARRALGAGAAHAVVDDPACAQDTGTILVEDAGKALRDLAIFHRGKYKGKVIAVTGSNGKTTTKELVARALARKYATYATKGNQNNHLGVPLTLLGIRPQVELAVVEMGASHVGEIAGLCEIADPEFGLITNIGEAHTETFGGIEGVLRGKSELFDHLRKNGGTPLINMADGWLAHSAKQFGNAVAFPADDLKFAGADPYVAVSLGGREVKTRLIGAYNFGNIAAAVAAGRTFDVPDDLILEAVSTYVPENQRSQVLMRGRMKIIVDCYNANPTSMKAALENLGAMAGSKAVVLGDMKEVENSEEKHWATGLQVKGLGAEMAVFIGEAMKAAHRQVPRSIWLPDVSRFQNEKIHFSQENILIKGSNSVKLYKIIDLIR